MRPNSLRIVTEEFLKLIRAIPTRQALRSAIDYGSDAFIVLGTWKWNRGTPENRRVAGLSGITGTGRASQQVPPPARSPFHSDDIEYVFRTLDTRPGAVWRPEDRNLSEADDELTGPTLPTPGDSQRIGIAAVVPKYGKDDCAHPPEARITVGP